MTSEDSPAHRLRAHVESVLAPLVAVDGGRLGWVGLRDDIAELTLGGACRGCPGQRTTLDEVLLPSLRALYPALQGVRVVTAPSPVAAA